MEELANVLDTINKLTGEAGMVYTKEELQPTYGEKILEIHNLTELKAFRDSVNSGTTYSGYAVLLVANIDLGGIENDNETWWTPIGLRNGTPFCGDFYGNNHIISNIYIHGLPSNNDQLSFFGFIHDSVVKSLTVVGTAINTANEGETNSHMLSGIVGLANGVSTMENCQSKVNITNISTTVGTAGILAAAYSTDIAGTDFTANSYSKVTIKNCINEGTLDAKENVAGIVSQSSGYLDLEVKKCENRGTIKGLKYMRWNISKCWWLACTG